jgi:hypothetical protein
MSLWLLAGVILGAAFARYVPATIAAGPLDDDTDEDGDEDEE